MKKIIPRLASAVAFSLVATVATAETYSCRLKDPRNSGWVPDQLVVQVNPDAKTARAFDPITYSTLDGYAEVTLRAENSVRVEMTWTTGRYRNSNVMVSRDMPNVTPVAITYHATLLRGGNKMLLRATPEGNQGRFSARGACQPVEGTLDQVVRR